jgi:predicted Zn-dependent protease
MNSRASSFQDRKARLPMVNMTKIISGALAVRLLAAVALAVPVVLPVSTLQAEAQQRRGISLVRDAEIEALVRDYARPILEAAGLGRSGIEIVLVNDLTFNAFVAGRRIFINTGALLMAETPNEIIGVLAHEAGHIAGGHQQRLREQLSRANTMAIISTLVGAGVAVGGSIGGMPGAGQAGMGIMGGGTEAARRSLMSYQRTEESTADRSALTYLEKTGQSARGMLQTFERLAGSMSVAGVRVDPYQISHPMPRERIANLETLARASRNYERRDSAALQQRHDMMRAKIAAYTEGHSAATRLFRDNPKSLPALYADAIGSFLSNNSRAALSKMDALIRAHPRNPYFHEMRGEILLKAGKAKEAAASFSRALQLDGQKSGLIQIGYGQALLASGGEQSVRKAVAELQTGLTRARDYSAGYRYLAQAHAQLGDIPQADLATADGHFYSGNYRDAKIFAARAQQRLPNGSPGWLRAQDIINYREPGRR